MGVNVVLRSDDNYQRELKIKKKTSKIENYEEIKGLLDDKKYR